MATKRTVLAALLIASFFWASSGVAVKTLLQVVDPLVVGLFRLTIASIAITPLIYRYIFPLKKTMVLDILPAAILSALNFLFFLFAMKYTTANISAVIYTATPISVALLSSYFIGERLTTQKIVGILVGFVGILITLFFPMLQGSYSSDTNVTGALLLICAMASFSLYNITTRRLTAQKHYEPLAIVGVSFYVSTIMFIVLNIILPHAPLVRIFWDPKYMLTALYLGIFVTIVPFTLHQWTIRHSSATTGSLTTYIQPIFGFVLNGIFLGETLTGTFLLGAVVVFVGVFIATGTVLLTKLKTFDLLRHS